MVGKIFIQLVMVVDRINDVIKNFNAFNIFKKKSQEVYMGKFKLSPVLFGIILIAFLLPFFNVSCGNNQMYSFSGFQTAFGTSVTQEQGFGYSRVQKVDADGVALAAFIVAILGLFLSFIKAKAGNAINTIASGAGTLLMIIFPIETSSRITKDVPSYIQVSYGLGYYLVLIFFIVTLAYNIYQVYSKSDSIDQEQQVHKTMDMEKAASFALIGIWFQLIFFFVQWAFSSFQIISYSQIWIYRILGAVVGILATVPLIIFLTVFRNRQKANSNS